RRRVSSVLTSSEHQMLLEKIRELPDLEAADEEAEAFARAATAYDPPAVLCGDVVGAIDVSAFGFSVDAAPPEAATSGDDILRRLDDLAAEVEWSTQR
ncbi:hypothetical protein CYMTET_45038, partial [Cymbomonas tetramitiformis]